MRIGSRRLQLCRETICRLDPQELRQARGGADIVSSDNRQCTYSKQCDPGVIANPPIGPILPNDPPVPAN